MLLGSPAWYSAYMVGLGGGGAGRRGGHIVYWRYWVIFWFWQDMRAAML